MLNCTPLVLLEREKSIQPCFLGAPKWRFQNCYGFSIFTSCRRAFYKSVNAWADLVSPREGPGSTVFRAIKMILSWKTFMA